jgi:hypothetical protein
MKNNGKINGNDDGDGEDGEKKEEKVLEKKGKDTPHPLMGVA